MIDLIGRRFRRNKYGISLWEDIISEVGFETKWITASYVDIKKEDLSEIAKKLGVEKKVGHMCVPYVIGTISEQRYYFDEILIFYS